MRSYNEPRNALENCRMKSRPILSALRRWPEATPLFRRAVRKMLARVGLILCLGLAWQCLAATELERIQVLDLISLEDTADEIDNKVGQLFEAVETADYLPRYPFQELLPYTNSAVVSVWRSKESVEGGTWPEIVFAVFSDERKTNLVDALWFKSQNIRPLVDGLYNQRLMAIKTGDSVTKLYRQVGHRKGNYFMAKDGKWRVRFFYWGHEGKMILIEADAATGVIVSARDGTI